MSKKLTQEEFIAKAVAAHGAGRYDYSRAVYSRSVDKLNIICPRHGLFEQEANAHLRGTGCPSCAGRPVVTTAEFITRARAVHGERYDYSRVVYVKSNSKLEIVCSQHGSFNQLAGDHFAGKGCIKCAGLKRLTTAEFITRARAVHGERYDYSRVVYVNTKIKVSVLCAAHGEFWQGAGDHMKGVGCPTCKADGARERERLSWPTLAAGRKAVLYMLRFYSGYESFYKIGITCTSVKHRYCSAESLGGYHYEIIAQHISQDAARIYDWEQSILETFAHLRYHPKHYFPGASECFSEAEPILAIFPL